MTFNVESVPNVTAPATETFTAGTAASFSVSASGVPSPSVSASGGVPGMSCGGSGCSGTPTSAGSYSVTFTASNAAGTSQPASTTVTVNSPPPPPPPKASIRLGATTAEVTENVAEVKATCANATCSGSIKIDRGSVLIGQASYNLAVGTAKIRVPLTSKGQSMLAGRDKTPSRNHGNLHLDESVADGRELPVDRGARAEAGSHSGRAHTDGEGLEGRNDASLHVRGVPRQRAIRAS